MQYLRNIRFYDRQGNEVFQLQDGGLLLMKYADGTSDFGVCNYIDKLHFRLTMDSSGISRNYDTREFAKTNIEYGNVFEPALKQSYKLEPIDKEEVPLAFGSKGKSCGYKGYIVGNFVNDLDCLDTDFIEKDADLSAPDMFCELDNIIEYFKKISPLPLLQNADMMSVVCWLHKGYEVGVGTDRSVCYKVVCERYSFYFRCIPIEEANCVFIYCYDNDRLCKYKDAEYINRIYGAVDANKFFRTYDGFREMYYCPDTKTGGRLTYMDIPKSVIMAAKEKSTGFATFFGYIATHCTPKHIYAGESRFKSMVIDFMESKGDLAGINQSTMEAMIKE